MGANIRIFNNIRYVVMDPLKWRYGTPRGVQPHLRRAGVGYQTVPHVPLGQVRFRPLIAVRLV